MKNSNLTVVVKEQFDNLICGLFLIGHLGSGYGAGAVLFDTQTMPVFDTEGEATDQTYTGTATQYNRNNGAGDDDTVYRRNRYRNNCKVTGTLTTQVDGGVEQINRLVIDGNRPRYLTPLECERLMGFPDNYTAGYSDTQRYKMLGNSMAVPVIHWIGKRILAADRAAMGRDRSNATHATYANEQGLKRNTLYRPHPYWLAPSPILNVRHADNPESK